MWQTKYACAVPKNLGVGVDFLPCSEGDFLTAHYGIPGCGVFKGGIQNKKGFWLKINCIQMKLPNFENWSNGELSKSTKI